MKICVFGFMVFSVIVFGEGHNQGIKKKIEETRTEIVDVVATFKKELKETTDKEKRKALSEKIEKLETLYDFLGLGVRVCDYETCKKAYCREKYNCRHYARDFCLEYRKKEAGFCESLLLSCVAKNEKSNWGHKISFVRKGSGRLCAIEPQDNSVIVCWPSSKYGGSVLEDMPPDAKKKLIAAYPKFKACEGTQHIDPADASLTEPADVRLCCECYDPSSKGKNILRPAVDRSAFYCTGVCADANKAFIRRVSCQ